VPFKVHKHFLFLFNKFLKEFFYIFRNLYCIKGLKVDVRGKVSAGGNSKKRHYLIKYGALSFSKKKNKISYGQNIVQTPTGVLGLEFVLVY
jgi:ribosomal protein S3